MGFKEPKISKKIKKINPNLAIQNYSLSDFDPLPIFGHGKLDIRASEKSSSQSEVCEMKTYIFLLTPLFWLSHTNGQSIFKPASPDKRLTIKAEHAFQKFIVDGKFEESDWRRCNTASGFIQSEPNQGEKADYETEGKILLDDKNIYIGAVCHNPGGKISVKDLRRDFSYRNNDLLGVFIDPFQDVQSPVQSFLVTPLSTHRDLLIYDDRIYDLNCDAVWNAKSAVSANQWSVEIAIPWSTLRYPANSTTWAINFNRNIRSLNQITGWSSWPFAYSVGRMAYSGLVTNLHPPKEKTNFRIAPFALMNAKKSEREAKFKTTNNLGGEVKWLMNTTTSLEATVNTDFAQADVDKQIINLGRSSVFLQERRQFFFRKCQFIFGWPGRNNPTFF